jgi:hypothetical protein
MSCYGGPEITNDGLVLYYDMGNTQKSWKGAPTTNLLISPSDFTNASWLKTMNTGSAAAITTESGIDRNGNIKTLNKLTLPSDGTYPRIYQSWTPASTATISFSVWLKAVSGTTKCEIIVFRNSPWASPSGIITANLTSSWQKFTVSIAPLDTTSHQIYIGSHDTAKGAIMYIDDAQLEVNSFPTPFVTGSRANTQALLDLTNSNTLTTSSLTYASDNSFSFNGTSNYVDVSSNSALQFLGTLPYTLEAWVYPTANPGVNNWTGIFNREANVGAGRDGFNMYFLGSAGTSTSFTTERFCSGVNTPTSVTLDQSLSVNNWNYLVATYDGTTLKLYRNGTLQSSVASSGSITNATTNLTVGKRDTNYFNGKISLAKVYNTALSADQIKQNFNALRGRYGI